MSIGNLARNAASSAGQVILSAGAMFLFYKILLANLTVEEVGLWALVMGSVTVARLSEFGLGTGVVRFVAHDLGAGDPVRAARTIGMAAAGVFLFICTAALVAWPLALPLILQAVPSAYHAIAAKLLPLALVGLVIGSVSNVFMSALDGCERMDLRAVIQLGGNLLQLALAWILTPRFGLVSLAWIQIAQASLALLCNAAVVLAQVRQPVRHYLGWELARFRELVQFGGSIQIAAIGQMLFEPVVKYYLTIFSGLNLTGYFEAGNRVAQQFRTVLVAGYNAIVPHVARSLGAGGDEAGVAATYSRSMRMMLTLSFPYFAVAGASIPIVQEFLMPDFSPDFIRTSALLWLAWSINTLGAPAYFVSLARGDAGPIVLSQVAIGILNVVVGAALGQAWGGFGALAGAAIALALGSLLPPVVFSLRYRASATSAAGWSFTPGLLLWAAVGYGLFRYSAPAALVWQFAGLGVVSLAALATMLGNQEIRFYAFRVLGQAISWPGKCTKELPMGKAPRDR